MYLYSFFKWHTVRLLPVGHFSHSQCYCRQLSAVVEFRCCVFYKKHRRLDGFLQIIVGTFILYHFFYSVSKFFFLLFLCVFSFIFFLFYFSISDAWIGFLHSFLILQIFLSFFLSFILAFPFFHFRGISVFLYFSLLVLCLHLCFSDLSIILWSNYILSFFLSFLQ